MVTMVVMILIKGTTMAALFTIIIGSSLILVSGSLVGSAFAVTNKVKQHHEYGLTLAAPFSGLPEVSDKEDMPSPQKSHSKDADDFDWMIGDINNDISDVKKLNVLREECNS